MENTAETSHTNRHADRLDSRGKSQCGSTHSTVDGAEGHETLHVVGQGAAVGVPVWVLSSLQDELLALEVMVLETHPALHTHTSRVNFVHL